MTTLGKIRRLSIILGWMISALAAIKLSDSTAAIVSCSFALVWIEDILEELKTEIRFK